MHQSIPPAAAAHATIWVCEQYSDHHFTSRLSFSSLSCAPTHVVSSLLPMATRNAVCDTAAPTTYTNIQLILCTKPVVDYHKLLQCKAAPSLLTLILPTWLNLVHLVIL
ncbi:hypothetical protein RJT34_17915 [Clitoria ternatea]|uniref:Uncharacterized protein n=1 Tax=Clitoria ternatea TaxID=43366 RepID=A0AAN9JA77_CLITE